MPKNKMIWYILLLIVGIYLFRGNFETFIIGGYGIVNRDIINQQNPNIDGTLEPICIYAGDNFDVIYSPNQENFVWAFDEWTNPWNGFTITPASQTITWGDCEWQTGHYRCFSAAATTEGYGQTATSVIVTYTAPVVISGVKNMDCGWKYWAPPLTGYRTVQCATESCGPSSLQAEKISFNDSSTFLVDDNDGLLVDFNRHGIENQNLLFADCTPDPNGEQCDTYDRDCDYLAGVDDPDAGGGPCGYDADGSGIINGDNIGICQVGFMACDPADPLCAEAGGPCYDENICNNVILPNNCNPADPPYVNGEIVCQDTPKEICDNSLDDDCDGNILDDFFPDCFGCITFNQFVSFATDLIKQQCVLGYCSENPAQICNVDADCTGTCIPSGSCVNEGGLIATEVPEWSNPAFPASGSPGFVQVAVQWVFGKDCQLLTLLRTESRAFDEGTAIAYSSTCGGALDHYGYYAFNSASTGTCIDVGNAAPLSGAPDGRLYLYNGNINLDGDGKAYLRFQLNYLYVCEDDADGSGWSYRAFELDNPAGLVPTNIYNQIGYEAKEVWCS